MVTIRVFDDSRFPAFLFIPKNASRSIQTILSTYKSTNGHTVPEGPIACMWRSPVARIKSAYRFFKHNGVVGRMGIPDPREMDFDTWLRIILDTPNEDRDPHVATQWSVASVGDHFLPTIVYRWDFEQLRADYNLTYDVPHTNASAHENLVWGPGLMRWYRREYQRDFYQWNF
jgi:hypothetical protein